jgi:hypothetical protein
VTCKMVVQDEKQTTFAITADMTRQYKSMQEELMRRINTLETTIMEQKDQLELSRQVFQKHAPTHVFSMVPAESVVCSVLDQDSQWCVGMLRGSDALH